MIDQSFEELLVSEVEARRSIKNLLALLTKGGHLSASYFFEHITDTEKEQINTAKTWQSDRATLASNNPENRSENRLDNSDSDQTTALSRLEIKWLCRKTDAQAISAHDINFSNSADSTNTAPSRSFKLPVTPVSSALFTQLNDRPVLTFDDRDTLKAVKLLDLTELPGFMLPIRIYPIKVKKVLRGIVATFGEEHALIDGREQERALSLLRSFERILTISSSSRSRALRVVDFSNHFASKLIKFNPLPILVVDTSHTVSLANPAACSVFNTPMEKLVGAPLFTFIPKQQRIPSLLQQQADLPNQYEKSHFEWRNVQGVRRGTEFEEFSLNITAFSFQHGAKFFRTLILEDLTQNLAKSREYQNSLLKFQVLTDLAPVAILHLDTEWNTVYVNNQWHEFSGLSHGESSGTHWVNGIHYDDVTTVLRKLKESVDGFQRFKQEFRLVSPIGKTLWVSGEAKALTNAENQVTGLLLCLTDIEARRQQEHKLKVMSEVDALTELGNRRLFTKQLESAFKRKHLAPIAIFLIDLDGFKNINDTLGHDAGDLLLQQVAERLKGSVRHTDLVCRLGGDEFTVLLDRHFEPKNVVAIAQKFITSLRAPIDLANSQHYVTASIGIAICEENSETAQQLLKQADIAMYHAKERGKNTFRFYNEGLNSKITQVTILDNHIHRALSSQEFYPVYQPIHDLQGVIGFEALLRWRHPTFRKLSPEKYIERMEENGLLNSVFMQLFDRIIKEFSELITQWPSSRCSYLSINLSAQQFHDDSLLNYLSHKLERYAFPPTQLLLEITERSLLKESKYFQDLVKTLKPLGVRFALDDFGTGYSSFTYLKKYPIDMLKIDRTFTHQCHKDPNNHSFVLTMVNLAHNLGLKVIAEGVESQSELEQLRQLECDAFQGYLFSKPMSFEAASSYIKKYGSIEGSNHIKQGKLGKAEQQAQVNY